MGNRYLCFYFNSFPEEPRVLPSFHPDLRESTMLFVCFFFSQWSIFSIAAFIILNCRWCIHCFTHNRRQYHQIGNWNRLYSLEPSQNVNVNVLVLYTNDSPRSGRLSARTLAGGYVTRVTNDAREDEMDTNVGQVGEMVGNLRNMAIDMGNEITSQNQKLDSINQKVRLRALWLLHTLLSHVARTHTPTIRVRVRVAAGSELLVRLVAQLSHRSTDR